MLAAADAAGVVAAALAVRDGRRCCFPLSLSSVLLSCLLLLLLLLLLLFCSLSLLFCFPLSVSPFYSLPPFLVFFFSYSIFSQPSPVFIGK